MSDLTEQARRVLEMDSCIPHSDWYCVLRDDNTAAIISHGWGPIAEIGGQSMGDLERAQVADFITQGRELLPLFAKEYLEHIHNEEEFHLTCEGIKLTEERDQLRAEVERLREELIDSARQLHLITHEKEYLESVEQDLQAARKVMEEIGSCLIGAKEAFRDPDIQSAERYCNRALAALNAELEKSK